jgi:uncharacterized membrane-anchored protein
MATSTTESVTVGRALRVPEITAFFWVIKALTTAMGESTSDYLVNAIDPVVAVAIGFLAFSLALVVQFSMRRYVAWAYWLAVAMVGVFGTMAADVLHVKLGVPYAASTVMCAVALVAVFVSWKRSEGTLSIHSIDTFRREAFYWATVAATFAFGTALGDLSASTAHLGYGVSAICFAGLILVPAIGFRWFGLNGVVAFWFAYIVTRPLGASFADWVGKSPRIGGLGFGDGQLSGILAAAIVVLVGYLSLTRIDVQSVPARLDLDDRDCT